MTAGDLDSQLTLLLEIQDLSAKASEIEAGSELGSLEASAFGIDVSEATALIRQQIDELVGRLSTPVARRYGRIRGTVDRVVVPVIAGTCYGCFVSVPTAEAGETDPNAHLHSCEHCGRFLYFLS